MTQPGHWGGLIIMLVTHHWVRSEMVEYIQIIFNKYIGHGCCFGAILKSPQNWAGHKCGTLHHSDIYWWNADIHPESETGGRSASFYSKVSGSLISEDNLLSVALPYSINTLVNPPVKTVFLRWTSFRALLAFQYWKKHNLLPQSKEKKLARLPLHFSPLTTGLFHRWHLGVS